MNAVALDSPAKRDFYMGVVASAREDYFWTGGSVGGGGVRWPSGLGQSVAQVRTLENHDLKNPANGKHVSLSLLCPAVFLCVCMRKET